MWHRASLCLGAKSVDVELDLLFKTWSPDGAAKCGQNIYKKLNFVEHFCGKNVFNKLKDIFTKEHVFDTALVI